MTEIPTSPLQRSDGVADFVAGLESPRRYYPIVVTDTHVRVFWAEGENPKDAAEQAQYSELTETDLGTDGDAWRDFEPAGRWDSVDLPEHGPMEACPVCGALEFDGPGHLVWARHAGTCPLHIHHAQVTRVADRRGNVRGWAAYCSCQRVGYVWNPYTDLTFAGPDTVLYSSRLIVEIVLRHHLADVRHSASRELGVADNYQPTEYGWRATLAAENEGQS